MNTHTALRQLVIVGMLLVAVAGVAAASTTTPGVPEAFYGTVTINGHPAADGVIVTAKVQNQLQGTGTTQGGTYGENGQPFKVADPQGTFDGMTVTFYVDNTKAGTATFHSGEVTKLDLSITKSTTPTGGTTGSSSGGGGGGGGGGGYVTTSTGSSSSGSPGNATNTTTPSTTTSSSTATSTCTPDWTCSDWTACSNNVKQRVCVDSNKCGTDAGRPNLTESCGQTPQQIFQQTSKPSGLTGFVTSSSGIGALIVLVAIALIVGAIFWNKKRKDA